MVERQNLLIYTVGHSTRSIEEFIEILKTYRITLLIDIRAIPQSRHNPQFNKEKLSNTLKYSAIKYLSLPDIGGLRHPKKNSINRALETNAFRGYADFMQTKEFTENLLKLVFLAKENCLAIMCAEALPWGCYRSLLSDALIIRRIQVIHIISKDSIIKHQLNELAHAEGTKISYPLSTSENSQKTLGDFESI